MPSLSIVVATLGRPTLRVLLASIKPQLYAEDEVLVIGDTEHGPGRGVTEEFGTPFHYNHFPSPGGYGGPQREFAIALASGEYINYQDDDDVMPADALSIIRQVINQHPHRPILFQMKWPDGEVKATGRGGQCFVFPNIPGKIGTFRTPKGEYKYDCDQEFIETTCNFYPGPILAAPYVISLYSGPHWGK